MNHDGDDGDKKAVEKSQGMSKEEEHKNL